MGHVPASWFAGVCAACCAVLAHASSLLTSHVPAAVASGEVSQVAAPDPSRPLQLTIALPMRDAAALEELVRQLYDPASSHFRQYLSAAEFTDRFGPTEADYAKAVQFFQGNGFTIVATAANRYLIEAVASVDTVQRVLHVNFGLYQHPTENRLFIAPDREPTLDLDIAVLHIGGLDDAVLPTTRLRRGDGAATRATGSGPGGQFLGSDMRAAYYASGTSAKLNGAGQTVGLMELVGYNPADVALYFQTYGPALTTIIEGVQTDKLPAICTTCDDSEQALDIEYAIAMAPGLKKVQVYVGNSPESVLNRMASDNTSAQLSTSWGWGENFAVDEPIFMQMAAQGQTLLTASGDYSSLAASGPWPEESAHITAVGGTDLSTTGPGGAWAGETGWSGSAGGPSLDTSITVPSYQLPFINAANLGSTTVRNVPDIAASANTNMQICTNGGCAGGYGGTSFASPMWAGFVALANQRAASLGLPRIGFLNPILYNLGGQSGYDKLFHDTERGRSGLYQAVEGFDLVTGFGSPHGPALLKALAP